MTEEYTLPEEHIITNLDTLKIIADPTRLEVMRTLKKPRTVKEVAEILDTDPTKLYYHVRQLEKHDLIRIVETNIVSGIIEKTYQVSARQFRVEENLISATEMTDENLNTLFSAIFDVTKDEIRRSFQAGLMKLGDKTPPEKYGTAKVALYLTEEQATELFGKLSALMQEYEDASKLNEENTEVQPHGLLFSFYPLYRPDADKID
jgi:DNA-binding transcriptional ArsR family regulator